MHMLAGLSTNVLSPFVQRWHGGMEALVAEHPDVAASFGPTNDAAQLIRGIKNPPGTFADDENQLARRLVEIVRAIAPSSMAPQDLFARVELQMLSCVPGLVWLPESSDVTYLRPIFDLADEHPLTVATLNYDETVECSAAGADVGLSTGMAEWIERGRLTWAPDDRIHLLKLHGSRNWIRDDVGTNQVWSEGEWHVRAPQGANIRLQPGIVFGEGNKLRADGPFLDLFAEFNSQLADADDLLVVGYSFRDDHINASILRWVNRYPAGRRVVIVSPSVSREGGYSYLEPVLHRLRRQTPQAKVSEYFQVVTAGAAAGLPDAIEILATDPLAI